MKNIEHTTKTKIDENIVINNLFFFIGSILGLKRVKVNGKFANYFGITFAPSGSGKDYSLDLIEKTFKFDYVEILTDDFKECNPEPISGSFNEDGFNVPNNYKIPLQGTLEGLLAVSQFFDRINKGSINLVETEFGSIMNKNITNTLIKLWQSGTFDGSVNVHNKYKPVYNVPSNVILFGSPSTFERDSNKQAELLDILESGLARRCFFVNSNNNKIEHSDGNEDLRYIELLKYVYTFIRLIDDNKEFIVNSELLNDYRSKLINQYNQEPTEINRIIANSIDKIERLSVIIAIINGNDEPTEDDISYAIDWAKKSNMALLEVFKPKQPYLKIFDYLKWKKIAYKTEVLDAINIKLRKTELEEQLDLLKDYAYRKDYTLTVRNNNVSMKAIEDVTLKEIIVSINQEGLKEKGKETKSLYIPFLDGERSIETLVKSNTDWFSFIHYSGTRNQKNAIPVVNTIAFDIDDMLKLELAQNLLIPYAYIIYTTRNHQKEKNGFVADRYRIILPLKKEFRYEDVNHYKEFVKNIAYILGIENAVDYSTVEPSRLWYTNSEALVYTNRIKELFDTTLAIPDTKEQLAVSNALRVVDTANLDKRIDGATKWAVSNAITGSRNTILFRYGTMVKDITGDKQEAKDMVLYVNSLLSDALSEIEIEKTIFKRLNK